MEIKTCKGLCGLTKQAFHFPKNKSVCKECRKIARKHKVTVINNRHPLPTSWVPSKPTTIAEAFNGWKV